MREDAFSKYHPAVNLIFFIGAICFGVLFWHPVYLLAGMAASVSYYLLLNGRKGLKMILGLLALFMFITLINPVVNTHGTTVLFMLFTRPYTLEALIYGVAVAAIFVVMMIWFNCCNKVLTSDKFTSLFCNILPSITLLLVMVFRMMPNLSCKAKQITQARASIGKGIESTASTKEKLAVGMTQLGTLISLALEGSVITGDSMKARGYAVARRSSFMIYRMTYADWFLTIVMLGLIGTVIVFAVNGCMYASFLPQWRAASIGGINILGFTAYLGYLLIPTVLHIKEAIQWNISRFKI